MIEAQGALSFFAANGILHENDMELIQESKASGYDRATWALFFCHFLNNLVKMFKNINNPYFH